MIRTSTIYFIFIIAYFGSSLEGYKIAPPYLIWSLELLIYLLFIYALISSKRKVVFPFIFYIAFFSLVAVFSVIVNNRINFEPLYGFRLLIRFYFFFLALVNLSLSDNEIKNINKFIFILFLIQIPVATIKLFIWGPGEGAIGTYSLSEGSLSTIITLIAIGYLIPFFVYYHRSFWYNLISFGFIYFSIIAKKRALVYMLPAVIFFQAICILMEKNIDSYIKKIAKSRILLLAPFIILIVLYFCIRFVPALNPEKKFWGSFDLIHSAKVFKEYFVRQPNEFGYTTSRFSTTRRVFSVLYKKGLTNFFFGYGPGSYTKSRFVEEEEKRIAYKDLRISYGVTPLTYIAIEYGILGLFPFFLFISAVFLKCFKFWKIADTNYWKAFALGTMTFAFSMILLWGTYHIPSFTGDPVPCLYYYCMAIVFSKYRIYRESFSKSN